MRFHRPDSGLGINDQAVASIRAARKLESIIALWDLEPDDTVVRPVVEGRIQPDAISDNSAYAARAEGQGVAVFLPANPAGENAVVAVDLTDLEGRLQGRWIDVDSGEFGPELDCVGGEWRVFEAPRAGNWAIVVTRAK